MTRMGRPIELPKPWAALAEAAGGVTELAAELETTTMTIWRWAHGRAAINGPTRIAIETVAKRHGLKSPA